MARGIGNSAGNQQHTFAVISDRWGTQKMSKVIQQISACQKVIKFRVGWELETQPCVL